MPEPFIREVRIADAAAVASIYNAYVRASIITFEENAVAPEEMAKRIAEVQARGLPWYLALEGERVAGYAYASPWRPRSAYRFSVEVTVYVAEGWTGRGIGTKLYTGLLEHLKERGFRNALAGIALPNHESVALHERFGFVKVAHFTQVGLKLGRWIDVGYWQKDLTAP